MTVKELKEKLEFFSDDAIVTVFLSAAEIEFISAVNFIKGNEAQDLLEVEEICELISVQS